MPQIGARRQRVQNRGGRELRAAQRAVDALAREGIEEVGGIADEQRAVACRLSRPARKRSGGEHAPDDARRVEASGDTRKAIQLVEEPLAAVCLVEGQHERDRRDAGADRPEPDIAGPSHVHFAEVVHVARIRDVRGERDSVGRRTKNLTQATRDNRA